MRFLPIHKLESNMYLARAIYNDDGRVLLNSGVKLNTSYIQRIRHLGIPGVYVSMDLLSDFEIPEVISVQTRQNAISQVRGVYESVRIGKTLDMSKINTSVNAILDEILGSPHILVNLSDIRSYDSYTFAHSVNVCVLSVVLGLKLGLNALQLKELAVGAILHDIGKIAISDQIILKPGPLTSAELEDVQKHCLYGWQLLRHHPDISLLSAHVAYQHHERPNGSGYPRKLKEEQISLYGKIVGVSDAYDAMTSERIYRSGMLPAEALRVIRQLGGIQFSQEVIDCLFECVAPYPVGSLVTLNSRQVGVVVDINQTERSRPVVRVLYQENGKKTAESFEVDLSKERYLSIVEVAQ